MSKRAISQAGLRGLADSYQRARHLASNVAHLRRRLRGEVDVDALVRQGMVIGRDVYLANWTLVDQIAAYLVTIGDETVISSRVQILTHDAAGQKHTGYTRLAPVTVGRRVYVGADVTIMPGVTIGDDAIVGAGSLVTRDVPPGMVVVGRPARVVTTTDDFVSRRLQAMEEAPRFTLADVATVEGRARVRRAVLDAGQGFIP